jgi:hypothetical protein
MKCPRCGHVILSRDAERTLEFMRREAPKRGGFMYEGARVAWDKGEYCDRELEELLAAGAIEPHTDPLKGWRIPELRLGGGEEPKEEQRSHEPVA